jgi:hypothetical protein
MKPLPKLLASAALLLAALGVASAHAAGTEILHEDFADVAALSGWTQVNQSVPPGSGWFQGNTGLFTAYSGAPDSYAAANFLGAANGSGNVDSWLITPLLDLSGLTTLSFFTRSAGDAGFADLLEVRFAYGAGSDPSAFGTLLTTVGGTAAYPTDWQQISASFDATGSGRFAFRYTGPADSLSYIGLDAVSVVTAVPEPASWAMLAAGMGLLGLMRRNTRQWHQ